MDATASDHGSRSAGAGEDPAADTRANGRADAGDDVMIRLSGVADADWNPWSEAVASMR